MALKVVLCVLCSLLLWTIDVSAGRDMSKQASNEEVKTIKTSNGDVYDCVDFYKQPAFQHPALKNHDFHPQMRPSSRPKQKSALQTLAAESKPSSVTGIKEACPVGTVPIRRVDQDELTRVESFMKKFTNIQPNSVDLKPGIAVAVSQTSSKADPKEYFGIAANLTLHNPPIEDNEYSSGRIEIQGGSDFIQVGWIVNPILYKDKITRRFIYTNAGQSQCFNTHCPGFVIVRTDILLDGVFTQVTEPGGNVFRYNFFIYQDTLNGNWWLEVGDDNTPIGFWPKAIFTGLAESGSYVSCGGEAFHPPEVPGFANMGTGFKPSKDDTSSFNAYCHDIVSVNKADELVIRDDTEGFTNFPDQYGARDLYILGRGAADIINDANHGVQVNGSKIFIPVRHIVMFGGTKDQ